MGWGTNLAVLTNWFPKKGRGLLIGIWASNGNIGSIIGAQLYRGVVGDNKDLWGYPLMIVGAFTILLGLFNLFFCYEFPIQKGFEITEDDFVFS